MRKVEDRSCTRYKEEREYSHVQELIDNIPYMLMTLIGASIIMIGMEFSILGIVLGSFFILYGIAGTVWFIIFICPYCDFHGTRSCPCGYGQISPYFRSRGKREDFKGKFRKHIPVIVPLWIVPIVAGIVFLVRDFSIIILILLAIFAIDSLIVLPLVSRKYGCAHCPQKDTCPWMR